MHFSPGDEVVERWDDKMYGNMTKKHVSKGELTSTIMRVIGAYF